MSDTEEMTAAPAAEKPVRRVRAKKADAEAPAEAEAPKRRGRPRKVDAEAAAPAAEAPASAEGAEAPKRRGRPRKSVSVETGTEAAGVAAAQAEAASEAPKRRGRPRKADVAAREAAAAEAAAKEQEAPRPAKPVDRPAKGNAPRKDAGAQQRGNGGNGGKNGKQQGGKQNGSQRDRHQGNQQRRQRHQGNREIVPSVSKDDLAALKVAELRAKAAELEVDATGLKKADLVDAVYDAALKAEGFIEVSGVLDILADGYGFLRTSGYLPGERDCYVGLATIRRNGLRKGDVVTGQTRPARENEKFAAIQKVISVNGVPVEELGARPKFADLTPVYPDETLTMEHGRTTTTARVIDLVAPIGKGQRGLIVSPPKAGKTTILKDIASAITANNPDVHLMCLLVDERPEEVTDMERSIRGEVISSTFDMPTENHIAVSELVIERAKRLVEQGRDVVILLDSITRLARAYNLAQPASGRILSGGVDSTALYPPKRFLGAARNIEGGGSLTILASALIDTGSKMDEVIFEEFKGTGNMELKLDRSLADRRIFPAIDPVASGTRKEELLLDQQEAPLIWAVRRILSNMNNTERAMDMLIKSLKQTDTNQEFLIRTAKKAQGQHGKSDEGFGF